jgi:hypothetical protein
MRNLLPHLNGRRRSVLRQLTTSAPALLLLATDDERRSGCFGRFAVRRARAPAAHRRETNERTQLDMRLSGARVVRTNAFLRSAGDPMAANLT